MQNAPSEQPLRVWSVDDHPITACALEAVFMQAGVHAVFSHYASPTEVRKALKEAKPVDLVIVDLLYPGESGIDLIAHLSRKHPRLLTLVYTARDDAAYVQSSMQAGSRGYLTKGAPLPTLVRAVRSVLAGEVYVQDEVRAGLPQAVPPESTPRPDWSALSRRERDVLILIGQGLNTHEIAAKLSRSVKTIETYRARIKSKLCLDNVTQLAQAAWIYTHEIYRVSTSG